MIELRVATDVGGGITRCARQNGERRCQCATGMVRWPGIATYADIPEARATRAGSGCSLVACQATVHVLQFHYVLLVRGPRTNCLHTDDEGTVLVDHVIGEERRRVLPALSSVNVVRAAVIHRARNPSWHVGRQYCAVGHANQACRLRLGARADVTDTGIRIEMTRRART